MSSPRDPDTLTEDELDQVDLLELAVLLRTARPSTN